LNSLDGCGGVYLDPSGGNLVHTFSLESKAEGFRSKDAEGAGLPTECLLYATTQTIIMNNK